MHMKTKEEMSNKLSKVHDTIKKFADNDEENAVFVIACSRNDNDEEVFDGFTYSSGHAWKFGDGFREIFKKGFSDDANKEEEELAMSVLFGMELLMREKNTAANNMSMYLLTLIKEYYDFGNK